MDLEGVRRSLLDARDARAALLGGAASRSGRTTLVFLSLNVPGPGKMTPRLGWVFARARAALPGALPGSGLLAEGSDALGPYALLKVPITAANAKVACVRLEESLPFGRLVDLDVLAPGGAQVDRASLGLPPRRCLVCDRAAVECIRTARHSSAELSSAALAVARSPLVALARALADGARTELDLTPKPGLVDRLDSGSHPDLSHASMRRSIDTLPAYYQDLIELADGEPLDLAACASAGIRAEERALAAAGSNAHRGYNFLSGLLLLAAAADQTGTTAGWRAESGAVARRLPGEATGAEPSHGEQARRRYRVEGVLGEAAAGLPSVFDHGLPALDDALARGLSPETAQHYAMAVLMTRVEDTTALHRCGPAGLARLKEDGASLAALIEEGGDHLRRLRALNDDYRAMRLTMGGVADCLALTLAVRTTVALSGVPG